MGEPDADFSVLFQAYRSYKGFVRLFTGGAPAEHLMKIREFDDEKFWPSEMQPGARKRIHDPEKYLEAIKEFDGSFSPGTLHFGTRTWFTRLKDTLDTLDSTKEVDESFSARNTPIGTPTRLLGQKQPLVPIKEVAENVHRVETRFGAPNGLPFLKEQLKPIELTKEAYRSEVPRPASTGSLPRIGHLKTTWTDRTVRPDENLIKIPPGLLSKSWKPQPALFAFSPPGEPRPHPDAHLWAIVDYPSPPPSRPANYFDMGRDDFRIGRSSNLSRCKSRKMKLAGPVGSYKAPEIVPGNPLCRAFEGYGSGGGGRSRQSIGEGWEGLGEVEDTGDEGEEEEWEVGWGRCSMV